MCDRSDLERIHVHPNGSRSMRITGSIRYGLKIDVICKNRVKKPAINNLTFTTYQLIRGKESAMP